MSGSIDAVSGSLLKKLKMALKNFCDNDRIILCAPHYKQSDFYIGVCLYDIQDFSSAQTSAFQYIKNEEKSEAIKKRPPKLIELGYMIFANEEEAFGGYAPDYGQQLLSEAIRAIYEDPFADTDKKTPLSFAFLSVDSKIKLWQSFTKPMQPAVYVNAGPVPIIPLGMDAVPLAKEREVKAQDLDRIREQEELKRVKNLKETEEKKGGE
jgi:hypothetical protein